jgi:hypothetical protein
LPLPASFILSRPSDFAGTVLYYKESGHGPSARAAGYQYYLIFYNPQAGKNLLVKISLILESCCFLIALFFFSNCFSSYSFILSEGVKQLYGFQVLAARIAPAQIA